MSPNDTAETAAPLIPGHRRALRAIALFEALKGLAALLAGIGLLELLHHDIHRLAVALLWRFHLDPALPYPSLLLHYADLLSALNLRALAPMALAYVALRLLEAWGLWRGKTWAEWLGALSGALYLPLEAAHWVRQPDMLNAAVLLVNLLVVGFLAMQLRRRQLPSIDKV